MASTTKITAEDVAEMVEHCLSCPPNGYLGMDYGVDVEALVQTPMASGLADSIVAKIRQDIPLLQNAPADMVQIYSYDIDFDKKGIAVDVAGRGIEIGSN